MRPAVARASLWLATIATIVFLPGALDRWFLPKAALLAIACAVAAFTRGTGRLPRWFLVLTAAAAAILLVSALLSDAPAAEFWGRWPRYEGAVMLPVYFAAVWLGARLLGPEAASETKRTFTSAVAVIAILLGLVSLLEASGLRPIASSADRPGALLGNASDQGLVGVMGLAILILPTLRAWRPIPRPGRAVTARGKTQPPKSVTPAAAGTGRRLLLVVALAASTATVVISASRGAAAACLVAVTAVAALELIRLRRTRRSTSGDAGVLKQDGRRILAVALLTLAVVAAATFALPSTRARFVSTSGLAFDSAADRLLIWRDALSVITEKPLLGWGPSGFLDAVARAHGAAWQRQVGSATTLDSPHDWLLQLASAGGIALLLVAVAAIVIGVIVALRRWAKPGDPDARDLRAGAIAILLALAIGWSTTFTAPGTVILAALLFGALIAREPAGRRAGFEGRVAAPLRAVTLVAWCAFLATAAVADIPLNRGTIQAAKGDVSAAQSDFDTTAALRPWDADVPSIAAQSLAAAADDGHADAARPTVMWARRALSATPNSLLAAKALAVGQQYSGDLAGASATLARLARDYPYDSEVAHRYGGVLLLEGNAPAATKQLERAAELAPKDSSIWKTLEYVYQQTGDTAGVARAKAILARLSRG